MKLTHLITKSRKEVSAEETAKNAQLLLKGGYVHKELAGVYTWLPLGLMVLDNISRVIREEMNSIGGQEMRLTALQDPEIWQVSGRWDDEVCDVWFKTRLKNDTELGLGPTHEEPIIRALRPYITSYRDLPKMAYQIQTKFRNELRAKSGVMRGREFLMKDLYSFARSEEEHQKMYESIQASYDTIFKRLGIGNETYLTFASGGMFAKFSHEFQTICDAGEDIVYVDEEKRLAVNEEVLNDEVLAELGLIRENLVEKKAAEVGNIFTLGAKYSEPLEMFFTDEDGTKQPVLMGCYGIGPSRLVGVITELTSDEKGLCWPEEVAPFKFHIVTLGVDADVTKAAEELYASLKGRAIWDDRDVSAGEKFADADLLGMPLRIVISKKTLSNDSYEIKHRKSGETEMVSTKNFINHFNS